MSSWTMPDGVPMIAAGVSASVTAGWAGVSKAVSKPAAPLTWWSIVRAGEAPTADVMRQNAVVAVSAMKGFGVVLVRRTDRGMQTLLGLSDAGSSSLVPGFARGAAGVAEPFDGPVKSSAEVVVEAVVQSGDVHAGGSSNLGDVSTVAASLPDVLHVGDWVAMAFRQQSGGERGKLRTFYELHPATAANARTHPALSEGGLVVSLMAGAGSFDDAQRIVATVAAGLHGFDVGASAVTLVAPPAAAMWLGAGAALGAATVVGQGSPWLAAVAATAGAMPSAALSSGLVSQRAARVRAGLEAGSMPVPPRRRLPVRTRREAKDGDGNVTQGLVNPYPLSGRSFPAGASHPLMLALPHSQAASAAQQTAKRVTPVAVVDRVGPRVGAGDGDGQPVHLSTVDRFGGIMLFGEAGSGKTTFVHDVWIDDLACRVRPSGLPGDAGANNTLIAFEFKSGASGARDWLRYADAVGCGDDVVFVDIHDPMTPRIGLFPGDDPVTAAGRFAQAWETSIEADSSGGRAGGSVLLGPTMTALFALALAVTPEIAADAMLPFGSVPYLAGVLAGTGPGGDRDALRLFSAIRTAAEYAEREVGATGPLFSAATPSNTGIGRAVTLAINLFENLKPSARADAVAPFARRLAALAAADAYFSRDRPEVSWHDLVHGHKVVVVNVGPPTRKIPPLARAGDDLAALLVESLRSEVALTCQGWQGEGRAITVYIEELAVAARRGAEAIRWFRNQGRFAGVRLVLATQDFDTLDPSVFEVVAGFSTVGFFALGGNPDVHDWALRYLNAREPGVWGDQLATLARHRCILSTTINGAPQPRVVVRPDFHGDDSAATLRRFVGLPG